MVWFEIVIFLDNWGQAMKLLGNFIFCILEWQQFIRGGRTSENNRKPIKEDQFLPLFATLMNFFWETAAHLEDTPASLKAQVTQPQNHTTRLLLRAPLNPDLPTRNAEGMPASWPLKITGSSFQTWKQWYGDTCKTCFLPLFHCLLQKLLALFRFAHQP